MKKLLTLLFSLLLSFNSYAEWIYIDKEKNSDAEIYVLTESIEVEDGYVYWTYLNNYSKPRSEYNIMGLAIFRGADCENNRYVNIESQMFQGSMGSEPFGDRLKPEQEWTTPTSGQIDEKIFNFVCEYAGLVSAQVEAEEESDQSRFSYLKNPENIKNHYVKDKETGKWKDLKKEELQSINGWTKIYDTDKGYEGYIHDNIYTNNGYVYWKTLGVYSEPIGRWNSSIILYEGDCKLMRKRDLESEYFEGKMADGKSQKYSPSDDEWSQLYERFPDIQIMKYACENASLSKAEIEELTQTKKSKTSINGNWEKIGSNVAGDEFYFDVNLRKVNGFIYFWLISDYKTPVESTVKGLNFLSSKIYYQLDCGILRLKELDSTYFSGQSGQGEGTKISVEDEWTYASPGSTKSAISNYVCDY